MEEITIVEQLSDHYHLISFKKNREICHIIEDGCKASDNLRLFNLDAIKELPEYVHDEYTELVEKAKMEYYDHFGDGLEWLKATIGNIIMDRDNDTDELTRDCHADFAMNHLEDIGNDYRKRFVGFLDYLFETVFAHEVCRSIIRRIKRIHVTDAGGSYAIDTYDLAAIIGNAAMVSRDKLKDFTHIDPTDSRYIIGVIEAIGPMIAASHQHIPLPLLAAAITLLCRIGYVNQVIDVYYR